MPTTPPTVVGTVASGRRTGSGLTPLTFGHTVTSDTDILFVPVVYDDFFATIPTVTWMGTDVPLLNSHQFATNHRPLLYALRFPAAGTGTIEVGGLTSGLSGSLAGGAINVAHYGGIRFGDWSFANFIFPTNLPLDMYTQPTDLLFHWTQSATGSQIVTPGAGQTSLINQDGLADGSVKLWVSSKSGGSGLTTITATQTTAADVSWYSWIVKGLEVLPAGLPVFIGSISDTMTLEEQANPAGFSMPATPPPGDYWHWRHRHPSTHPFMAVLFGMFDQTFTPITEVAWLPDGGTPQLLTEFLATANCALWYATTATAGTGYLRVKMSNRRWFDAGVYSLSTSGIIAAAAADGFLTTLDVASEPDAIVIDLIKQHSVSDLVFTPAAGQTTLFAEPIKINNSVTSVNTGTESGASSYKIAIGNLTTMDWTLAPAGVNQHIAFSFLGVTPPPPVTRFGCPDTLPLAPVTGTGCATQVSSPAV